MNPQSQDEQKALQDIGTIRESLIEKDINRLREFELVLEGVLPGGHDLWSLKEVDKEQKPEPEKDAEGDIKTRFFPSGELKDGYDIWLPIDRCDGAESLSIEEISEIEGATISDAWQEFPPGREEMDHNFDRDETPGEDIER